MPDIPEIPLTTIDDPTSTDLDDATNVYPLLESIQGPPNADSVGPEAANRQPRALDLRTETLRTAVNALINVANSLTANLLHRDGVNATDPSFMIGALSMTDATKSPPERRQVKNMADATDDQDAVTKTQLDALQTFLDGLETGIEGALKLDGTNAMAANLNMGSNRIINVADPINVQDGVNKQFLDATVTTINADFVLRSGANALTGNLDMGGNKVVNLDTAVPVNQTDAISLSYLQSVISDIAATPTGTIAYWAGAEGSLPAGWALCDGHEELRVGGFAALFAVIGTTYGNGDGSTTFNLPDLRGRVIAGKDNMGGVSANILTDAQADILGGTLGAQNVTLVISELPSHTHGFSDQYIDGDAGGAAQGPDTQNSTSTLATIAATTASTGGDGAHANVQPTMALNVMIKI